ncbi:MAG: hypothetical protein ACO1SV_01265 [Fimbriimonas sp.]
MKHFSLSNVGRFGILFAAATSFATAQAQASLEPISMQWTKVEWTASDAPFAKTRAEVDRELAASKEVAATIRQYMERAKTQPSSALDQFRWGYALVVARFPPGPQLTMRSRFRAVRIALAKAADPEAAEYARVRFLIESYVYPPLEIIPDLVHVGKRLSERNPQDRPLTYALTTVLLLSKNPRDRDLAVTLARRLLEGREGSYPLLKLMAGAHARRFEVRKLEKDRDQAILYYRKMLNLVPAGNPERRMIEGEIRYLRGIKN